MSSKLKIQPFSLEGTKGYRAYLGKTPLSRKPVEMDRALQQADALRTSGKLDDVKAYPLSETDMRAIIPTLKIQSYTDLLDASELDDVLDDKGRLMLLYLTENESTGHWICLLKLRDSNVVEFMDPYGNFKPDGEKKWLTNETLREFGQDTNKLTKLLRDSSYTVKSSAVPFQQEEDDNNTCGKHCLLRLYMKHLSLPEYAAFVADACEAEDLTPDEFVCGFVHSLIGK